MGGHQVYGQGSGDDGYDEEGYDESQRAEILEATRDGPGDGTIIVDLDPDIGSDDDAEDEDELVMTDGEVARQDGDVDADDGDVAEDEVQADFDDGNVAEDDLDDRDDTALRP
ncbi:DNA primase [Sphingomonas sp. 8AM]|uniref:DNA primase n=1 Tax=Sphingomonas sp. 8AM TaxID=2653170 RepID=UPI001916763C|nr:DNA primase [Sphingomonas sp. 8AM]